MMLWGKCSFLDNARKKIVSETAGYASATADDVPAQTFGSFLRV